jgi:2-polyprenyl-3-methyl-5-hydroxy-6-metoxy-1,4-benzoquinol methylase
VNAVFQRRWEIHLRSATYGKVLNFLVKTDLWSARDFQRSLEIRATMGKGALEARLSDAHYGTQAEFERSSKVMMREIVPSAPAVILDVGCGTGLNASFLKNAGHTVVGVDISTVAIEQFRAKGFEGFVCDIDAQPLPIASDSIDVVYASEVIEHVFDTKRFLSELTRVLKPGGLMIVSTPNSAFWAYRILGLLGRTVTEYQHPGHVRFFSRRSLRRNLQDAGLDVTAVSARHMYLILGSMFDPLAGVLKAVGFSREDRFATGGHFWQLSRFARTASSFWADTLFVIAIKPNK